MNIRSVAVSVGALALAVAVGLAGEAGVESGPTPHPHFNDGGTLSWSTKLANAQIAAKASGKLILIEYGREDWGLCKALVQSILPNPKVRDRVAKLCVGLAAPCDPPGAEYDLQRFLQTKFPEAPLLPWVGFVTADLEWVGGLAGKMSVDTFDAALAKAEASPLVPATPEAVKKLEAILAQAAKGAEKSDWKTVLAAAKAANEVKGRTPVRDKLAEVAKKAREFAESELAAAVESLTKGSDRAAVRTSLKKVSATFAGEPEQKDADLGVKAIDKLGVMESLAAEQQDAAREKVTKDFAGTRWVALFEKSKEEPPR